MIRWMITYHYQQLKYHQTRPLFVVFDILVTNNVWLRRGVVMRAAARRSRVEPSHPWEFLWVQIYAPTHILLICFFVYPAANIMTFDHLVSVAERFFKIHKDTTVSSSKTCVMEISVFTHKSYIYLFLTANVLAIKYLLCVWVCLCARVRVCVC